MWHEPKKRWWFLPRRFSTDPYDEDKDELRGYNIALSVPDSFKEKDVVQVKVGDVIPSHGFSAFRFVPGRPNHIIALKSREEKGVAETCRALSLHSSRSLTSSQIS